MERLDPSVKHWDDKEGSTGMTGGEDWDDKKGYLDDTHSLVIQARDACMTKRKQESRL